MTVSKTSRSKSGYDICGKCPTRDSGKGVVSWCLLHQILLPLDEGVRSPRSPGFSSTTVPTEVNLRHVPWQGSERRVKATPDVKDHGELNTYVVRLDTEAEVFGRQRRKRGQKYSGRDLRSIKVKLRVLINVDVSEIKVYYILL